ncbi:Ig-like domain-containing protein [Prochlorococcus sp. MIT 1323]|uniref:Ig-like domain-containing protein n=2 Tax=Prochlorococcus TaxID=1218 RepID=UPI0039B528C5
MLIAGKAGGGYYTPKDLFVNKLNANDSFDWSKTLGSVGAGGRVEDISVGSKGEIYIIGQDYDSANNNVSHFLSKYIYKAPDYAVTTTQTSIGEGEWITTTVSTENVDQGTEIYWEVEGVQGDITLSDFSQGELKGFSQIDGSFADGGFTISHLIAKDLTTEGLESMVVKLFSDGAGNELLAQSATVEINDTSTTPPTYALEPSASTLNEGQSLDTTVKTTDVAQGTELFWALQGENITADDLSSGELSGSNQVDADGNFSFSQTFAEDLTTEGLESLIVKLFSDQSNSQLLAESSTIQINDTSTKAAPPSTPDLIAASDSGISNSDNLTNVNTPSFSGTAKIGSSVELFADGISLGSSKTDNNSNWSFTVANDSPLADGSIAITATSTETTKIDLQRTAIPVAAPGRSTHEYRNEFAFAALKDDGSVITWGDSRYGGDSSSVDLELSSGVNQIFSTSSAFAALKDDGSVVTWGGSNSGGDSSSVDVELSSGVKQIFSSFDAFAAVKDDGSVATWGNSDYGGDSSSVDLELSSGVNQIFSTSSAFAALKDDGSVVTWGGSNSGGDSSSVDVELSSGVNQIFSTSSAFAALKDDGSVVTWGVSGYGGDNSSVDLELSSGVNQIFSTSSAFAALKDDGSVVTWGNSTKGGDSSKSTYYKAVDVDLSSGVSQIFSTSEAFAALKADGSVVTWGFDGIPSQHINFGGASWGYGSGNSNKVAAQLSGGVNKIFSTEYAFAALKDNGSVVSWGNHFFGGDSSNAAVGAPVDLELSSGVSEIFSTNGAFAALKDDGSVVSWGSSSWGGNSSSVADQLSSGVSQIFSTYSAFAAVKDDGSVVTWGASNAGGDSSNVDLELSSGVVSFADPFHDDRLTVTSTTSDPSDPLNLTIDATAPAFSSGDTATPIAENSGAAQVIYTAATDDASEVSYSLKQSNSDDAESFSIAASTGQVSLKDDPDYETNPSYSFSVFATDVAGNNSEQKVSLSINNIYETYILNTSTNWLNEGESLTTNITTDADLGTELFWALQGENITADDLSSGQLSGSNQVGADGNFSFSQTFAEDLTTEGLESLIVKLFSDQTNSQLLAESSTVQIKDTSTKPAPPSTPDLIATSDSGISNSDDITSDNTPTFSGTAKAGSSVELFADGVSLGSSITDKNTNWSYTVANNNPLADGSIVITATSTETSSDLQRTAIPVASPGRSTHEHRNNSAFAALKDDGSVVTWGRSDYGGDSSSVADQLSSGVNQIFSSREAFAALKDNGSVVTWGHEHNGDSSSVSDQLSSGVNQIFSTASSFAALKDDGSVVSWGSSSAGGDSSSVAADLSSGVNQIFSTASSFAALKDDGSVVSWGSSSAGGDSSSVSADLSSGVNQIFSTGSAFAAVKDDGSVVTWGNTNSGGDSSSVDLELSSGVSQIFSTDSAFAAVKDDGSVVTWGESVHGGDSSSVADQLSSGVNQIFSTESGFAALKGDSSVVSWGLYVGDSSKVADQLSSGVSKISSTDYAFAAIKDDGSVVAWGVNMRGGNSSSVADQLSSGVKQIFANKRAFAALKDDGSVITWGRSDRGGDSSNVADQLSSGVNQIFSTDDAFAAVKDDGSVVTWGISDCGGDSSSVAADLSSGVVSFADPFDDRLTVTTSTSDLSDPLNLTIDTTAPAFFSGDTATAIAENSGADQVIYTASTDDALDISYSLKQSNSVDAESFSINASTGKVILKDDPDYETKPSYSFSISATDLAGNKSEQEVSLSINNIFETYRLNTSTNDLNEGESLTTNIITDADLGTELFWALQGENITADDLSSGELSGSNQVGADGKFSFSQTFAEDLTTEGLESLIVKLFSDQSGNDLLAQSATVEINDTSTTPPTYSLETSALKLNEGKSLDTTVKTTDVAQGTELFWSLAGDNITTKDLVDGQLSGSNHVNGQGEFAISNTFAEDWRREGTENVLIKLFSDSARLSQVAETGSIEITDTSVSISETWPAKVGVTELTDLKLAYKLNSTEETNHSQLAVLGDNVDFSKRYTLEISGEVTGETKDNNYNLEAAEIIVKLDPFLFNTVKASDIRISNDLPIANAVHIDEDTGNIRIAAAGLSALSVGNAISSETVLASIDLDIKESYLQLTDQAAGDLNRKFSDPLLFSLAANQDHTIFSRDFDDGTTHSNREIKSLRELGGDLAVEGNDITLFSGNLNLEEQADGLVLGTDRVIGVKTEQFTNLVRYGDTIQASSVWTNTGNIKANDIQVTGVSNSNAELTSYYFDTGVSSVDLNSGRFDNGIFDTAERQSTQLNAEIKITGSAGNVVDLSSGIVNLKAREVAKTFENTKGSKNLITFQGDLNYDGSVTMKDLAYLNAGARRQQLEDRTGDVDGMIKDNAGKAIAEGETKSQASKETYAADVDADFNGKIDIKDLAVLDQDWGKTLHIGDNDFQGKGTNFTWAELNTQTGISQQWNNKSFEDQNALEAKASIGGYDAPLEQILSVNTADSNKDADAVTQSEIVTGSGSSPSISDIQGEGLQDDVIGGSSQ